MSIINTSLNANNDIRTELVPNQSKFVDTLVKQYKALAKASSENILELAKTIHTVEKELNERYKLEFYSQVGLDAKGSTVRKLKVIGEKSPRFIPYLEKLPNTWTTIYALAKMGDHDFQKVVDAGVMSPFATMKDIEAVVAKPCSKEPTHFRISVDVSKVAETAKQREFVRRLKQLVDEFHLDLSTSSDHEEDLKGLIDADETNDMKQAA